MEGRVENRSKRKLRIDWEEVLPERNDEAPPELIVTQTEPLTPAQKSAPMSVIGDDSGSGEELDRNIPDHELGHKIARMKETFGNLRHNLPDKGEKFMAKLTRLEKERERRRLARAQTDNEEVEEIQKRIENKRVSYSFSECENLVYFKDVDGYKKPTQSTTTSLGASDCFTQRTSSSQIQSKSPFTSAFSEKMEENRDSGEANAFDTELSILANCDRRKMRPDRDLSQRGRQKYLSSSRKWPCHRRDKSFISNGFEKDKASFTHPSHENQIEENLSNCLPKKKDAFEVLPLNNSRRRKGQTLVLLDEDESPVEEEAEETLHAETTEEADELAECMKDSKIYYPSRVDPESVEICYMDINHLAPTAYLTSPIMNFYIRYLQVQASPTNRAIRDCHFFNTYFYSKLKEAVSHKRGDSDSFFIKFRRWWKGINIFQKSYVLIPIHEDVHWSLVIICIPDKEDESGPIILHLDSLKLHYSQSIFSNIRSFLREEWKYLKQEVFPSDLPIAGRIWQRLPRRIDDKIIPVPQQKNDYDCGLFVLFFMERFIEEAPERLKKKDLAMFGKQWFRPEEASGLRVKIRKLLKEQFLLASAEGCISKSSSSSAEQHPETGADITQVV